MCAKIRQIENYKSGEFEVVVNFNGRYEKFPTMMDAQKWVNLMKASGKLGQVFIELKQIVIMATKQLSYESCYVY